LNTIKQKVNRRKIRRIATFSVVDLVFCYGVERDRSFSYRISTLLELLHFQTIARLSFVSCNRLSFDSAESAENAVDTMKSTDKFRYGNGRI